VCHVTFRRVISSGLFRAEAGWRAQLAVSYSLGFGGLILDGRILGACSLRSVFGIRFQGMANSSSFVMSDISALGRQFPATVQVADAVFQHGISLLPWQTLCQNILIQGLTKE